MNLRLLAHRDFFLLWQGSLVSLIGSQFHLIASMIWLKSDQALELYIPAYLMCASVPIALVGIFGGKLADRCSGVRLMAASDFTSGMLAVFLGVLFFFSEAGLTVDQLVLALLILTSLISMLQAIHKPASLKMVKHLVAKKNLCDGHSWIELSNRLSAPVGQWLGGLLMVALGPGVLFVANGLSFIGSGLSELFIKDAAGQADTNIIHKRKETDLVPETKPLLTEDSASLLKILDHGPLRKVLLMTFGVNLLLAPVPALIPFLATDFLSLPSVWIGYLFSFLGIGLFLGVLLAPGLWNLQSRYFGVETGLSFFFSLAFILLFFGSQKELICIGLIFLGMTASIMGIHFTTKLQMILKPEHTGKVMGLVVSMAYLCTPLSLLFVSLTLKLFPLEALKLFFIPGCLLGVLYAILTVITWCSSVENSGQGEIP